MNSIRWERKERIHGEREKPQKGRYQSKRKYNMTVA
jgi:hypothetical protein